MGCPLYTVSGDDNSRQQRLLHIVNNHPEWPTMLLSFTLTIYNDGIENPMADAAKILGYTLTGNAQIDQASVSFAIFSRFSWAFRLIEDEAFRSYCRITLPLSARAVVAAGQSLARSIRSEMLQIMPQKIGIEFDVWKGPRNFFLAVIGIFPRNGIICHELLGFKALEPIPAELASIAAGPSVKAAVLPANEKVSKPRGKKSKQTFQTRPATSLRSRSDSAVSAHFESEQSHDEADVVEDNSTLSAVAQDDFEDILPESLSVSLDKPVVTVQDLSLGARKLEHYLDIVLSDYGMTRENVLYLVGDNCRVNKALATKLGIPFVGCHAHLFNLAVKEYFDTHFDVTAKVYVFMKKCRNSDGISKAVESWSGYVPAVANTTRWRSMAAMLRSYVRCRSAIPFAEFPELNRLQLTPNENHVADMLLVTWDDHFADMFDLLDSRHVSLAVARQAFDQLLSNTELSKTMARYLHLDTATLLNDSKVFISAVCKVAHGRLQLLTDEEIDYISAFKTEKTEHLSKTTYSRSILVEKLDYNVEIVSATSCAAERVFSDARLMTPYTRKRLSSDILECQMLVRLRQRHISVVIDERDHDEAILAEEISKFNISE